MDVAELLSRTGMFGQLPPESLTGLAERFEPRSFGRGQTVFEQGEPGDALYVVASGLLKVVVASSAGDEMVLVTLQTPDTFGELALVDGGPRSTSVEAAEEAVVLSLDRDAFRELLSDHPALVTSLLSQLGGMVRRVTEQAADLVFLDLFGRVAKLLVGMAERAGADPADEVELDLGLTQSDLAAMVGGSRQSVNQILRSFERRGLLHMEDGRHLVILDLPRLRKRAGLSS